MKHTSATAPVATQPNSVTQIHQFEVFEFAVVPAFKDASPLSIFTVSFDTFSSDTVSMDFFKFQSADCLSM